MQRIDALLQLREMLLVDQVLDQLRAARVVLALPVHEPFDELQPFEERLHFLERGLRIGRRNELRLAFGHRVHGSSAAGMRARIICVLRASQAVLRWRS